MDCDIEIKGVVVIDDSKLEDKVEGWVDGNIVYNTISGSHVMLRMMGDVHRFVGEVTIRPSKPDG